ncbi:SGNH hydrolase-type esterase domain-containing protein [Leptodontidium sp. 2 PMI_412]|nr:SGNH hydrolase-type esterase domain-containing protein [Leptodontidium sp. 2 PMI_412]
MTVNKYPQLLLLGDSILQYTSYLPHGVSFGAGLAEHCIRRLDVINRGLSGYNTANVLVILEDLIPSTVSAKVDYLLVLLGSNDACLPQSPSKQHVALDKYRENLRTILTHPSITAHSPKILLVTPPPVNEVHLQENDFEKGYSELTRVQKVTAQYAGVVRELATEFKDKNVVQVDLWTALMKEGARLTPGYVDDGKMIGTLEKGDNPGLRSLLLDGLHLTAAGYKVFLDEVVPVVGPEWAQESELEPNWIFPHWSTALRIDRS